MQPVPAEGVDSVGLEYEALPESTVREAPRPAPAPAVPPVVREERASDGAAVAVAPRAESSNLRWAGVIAGLFIAVGVALGLAVLGAAIGLSVLDARGPEAIAGVQTSAGVWAGIVLLIAALAGGWVAARTSNVVRRTEGVLVGILVWSISLVAAFALSGGDIFTIDVGALHSSASESKHTQTLRGTATATHPLVRVSDDDDDATTTPIHEAAQTAWGLFLGVAISFSAAALGGAAGARGTRRVAVVPSGRRERRVRR